LTTILNINTAFETASVNLSIDEEILVEAENNSQKDHASFLEPAIKKICRAAGVNLNSIDAISVINGPGSYTGLRVGLSSAKALCYALKKPLILLNTLDVMAKALKLQSPVQQENILFCPLIDARRQEVYTGLYDYNLNLIKHYSAEILDNNFLQEEKNAEIIVAGGTGSHKLQEIVNNKNILYINPLRLSKPSVILANRAVILKENSDLVYSEPFYLKPVYFRNANL
jgi:tRNA threonylcarbamoyladenosine biosynthesis protein TsaB